MGGTAKKAVVSARERRGKRFRFIMFNLDIPALAAFVRVVLSRAAGPNGCSGSRSGGRLSLETILPVNWFARLQNEPFLEICDEKSQGSGSHASFLTRNLLKEFLWTVLQCRKCRIPVKTIARPSLSAAPITSSSLTEPPGWMTAVAPAFATASRPSGKGKKASEAATVP